METTVCAKCGNTGIIGNGPTSFNPKACDCGLTNHAKGTVRKPTPYDGKRAEVIAKAHPHYGDIAYCRGAEMTGSGWGMVFENTETSQSFFVFKGTDIKWI